MIERIAELLPVLIDAISPEVRRVIVSAISDVARAASRTPNPYDDLAVGVLKAAFKVEENWPTSGHDDGPPAAELHR